MTRQLSKGQSSELFLVGAVVLWSLFPIITILIYKSLTPLFTAASSTLIAALFFSVWLTYKDAWLEIRTEGALRDILWATLIIGVIFYSLVFTGLKYTTAGDASIIAQMEVFFTMVILSFVNKTKPSKKQILGAILMVAGASLILMKSSLDINKGNAIILAATTLPAMGNYFQKQARKKVSSASIMFWRSLMGGIFLFILAASLEPWPDPASLKTVLGLLLANGLFMFGLSKILWIESIHLGTIIKSSILGAMAPAFTLLFAFLILHEEPTLRQLSGFLPIIFGIILLTDFRRQKQAIDRIPLQ